MSATAHAEPRNWVSVHRAAVTIVILCMALAASLGLLATRLIPHSVPAPASSVSHVQLQPTDSGCQSARPGGAC